MADECIFFKDWGEGWSSGQGGGHQLILEDLRSVEAWPSNEDRNQVWFIEGKSEPDGTVEHAERPRGQVPQRRRRLLLPRSCSGKALEAALGGMSSILALC